MTARKGDMLCVPFQCDACWFINLKGRPFDKRRAGDRLNICLIRRVNLDMFWEKEPSTVNNTLLLFSQSSEIASHLGIRPDFMSPRKGWPIGDRLGFGEAMIIIWQSLQPGKNSSSGKQFDTVRKIRGMSGTLQLNSARTNLEGMGFKVGGHMFNLTQCSINSTLFSKFIKGCEKRMGRNVKQDSALSVSILLKILGQLKDELKAGGTTETRKRNIIMIGSCLVIGFCDALRGNEIFLVEAGSLGHYFRVGIHQHRKYVIIPLMGRFKGETGERNILRALVNTTKSGIQVHWWISELVELLSGKGRNDTSAPGPAFCDKQGNVLSYSFMNSLFHEELQKVQDLHPDEIPPEVDISETYNLYRSLRRGATSRATELGYSETIINMNNRWRLTQSNKGVGGLKKMSQLYVEMALVKDSLLQFSSAL